MKYWALLLIAPAILGQHAKEFVRQSVQRDLLNFERLKMARQRGLIGSLFS